MIGAKMAVMAIEQDISLAPNFSSLARSGIARQGSAMNLAAPPLIFSPKRRAAAQRRMQYLQSKPDPARYLTDDAASDFLERLAFLRYVPRKALVLGDLSGTLTAGLIAGGTEVSAPQTIEFSLESPWPISGFDFIACLFTLDTANDLPGTLIHMRHALAPGGLAIATLAGAGSLPTLREVMLAADGDRPAPRLHPQIDVRAGGQLMQRAGYAGPVVDTCSLHVRYSKLETLITDLRAQGLGNVLADPGPPLSVSALARAQSAFTAKGDAEGRVTETFELLTLSGWQGAAQSG